MFGDSLPDDTEVWRRGLGLLPVPLFSDKKIGQRYVLLNGSRGSFCLDLRRLPLEEDTRNIAWSTNVGHYVALLNDHVEVQRWDQTRAAVERYTQKSVYDNLERFHSYLEKSSPRQDISIISHVIQVFRRLRATLGGDFHGSDSLRAFLYLLACATERKERGELNLGDWRLPPEAVDTANEIREADWVALKGELLRGRPIEKLIPDLRLLLRHASGQLFQEAHYEAVFFSQDQLMLDGFLPRPIRVIKESKASGIHFTPPALARTLVEEALIVLHKPNGTLVIFDPACGSGEFLREALRQQNLRDFKGRMRLVGWDISESACDMAKFVLAQATRDVVAKVTIEIQCRDSLDPDAEWPRNVDLVLMNPPFVSWQDMGSEQQKSVSDALGDLARQRPDISHAFLWKAASCLRDGGVLGTIMPASFLDGASAERVRDALADHLAPLLIARLGSHQLFAGSTIDAALYLAKKRPMTDNATLAFWADYRASSTSAGLRTLRKIRDLGVPRTSPVVGEGFSIYVDPTLGRRKTTWAPRPYSSWKLLRSLSYLPRVADLFSVSQGARTGHKQAFVIERSEWVSLPDSEKAYFRPAVVNESIHYGFLRDVAYVFFPYGEYMIERESELREVVGEYYKRYLRPAKSELLSRSWVNPARWWELQRPRVWQVERIPKIVSTYFGDAGSFGWDATGDFAVVQGMGWLPNLPPEVQALPQKVGLAYLAALNSQLFSELLAATSNHVGGGQWNLSKKFVDLIALPNLLIDRVPADIISELAQFGRRMHEGQPIEDKERYDEIVNTLYGAEQRL